jgi:hypothetical protein
MKPLAAEVVVGLIMDFAGCEEASALDFSAITGLIQAFCTKSGSVGCD